MSDLLVASFGILLGLIIVGFGINLLRIARVCSEKVEARVLEMELTWELRDQPPDRDGRVEKKKVYLYTPVVEYHYGVRSYRVRLNPEEREEPDAQLEQSGGVRVLRINPDNPTMFIDRAPTLSYIMGAICFVFGTLALIGGMMQL